MHGSLARNLRKTNLLSMSNIWKIPFAKTTTQRNACNRSTETTCGIRPQKGYGTWTRSIPGSQCTSGSVRCKKATNEGVYRKPAVTFRRLTSIALKYWSTYCVHHARSRRTEHRSFEGPKLCRLWSLPFFLVTTAHLG